MNHLPFALHFMSHSPDNQSSSAALGSALTQSGESLLELSRSSRLLIVFLRHGGCPFCRETLAQLADCREEVEATGVRLALVHMMPDEEAHRLFTKYGLADVARISDPEQKLHGALSLNKGSALDVMGPKVWWAGFKSVLIGGHRFGRPSGDVFQLGGAFLVHNGEILAAHRSKTSFEQPEFIALAKGEWGP
ncbi:MAG: redoxin domain-containing protein [Planctomycetaceae bacterium]|nr:redoxin domain-containing protein [Planctomycetaceae bacterium]MBT6157926.1 redoxin domain-containing protein [Planctomycetaceae bacterium]MBT6487452.1 redoxin domain-containing protein [Planctomycetaceae bacterium]